MEIYKDFGFEEITIKFSDRPINRAGSDEVWDQAEKSLINAVESAGYNMNLIQEKELFMAQNLSLF